VHVHLIAGLGLGLAVNRVRDFRLQELEAWVSACICEVWWRGVTSLLMMSATAAVARARSTAIFMTATNYSRVELSGYKGFKVDVRERRELQRMR
jgi:hypothetical protein